APIRRLPQDVLGEIFKLVSCKHPSNNSVGRNGSHSLATLALSQVCSRWYNMVVSMPALWSSFQFGSKQLQKPHPMIPLFLERSRLHKLSFWINVEHRSTEDFYDATDFFSTQKTNRWGSVIIHGQRTVLPATLLRLFLANGRIFPELRNFTVRFSDLTLSKSITITCPKLQYLELDRLDVDLKFTQPCHTANCTDLRGLTFQHASRILDSFPNVRIIILDIRGDDDFPQCRPLTLHHARIVRIITQKDASSRSGFVSSMLDTITSPELDHLMLASVRHTEAPYVVKSICSLLTRSQARLTFLTLRRIPFTSRDLTQLLHLLPNLTCLQYKENSLRKGKFVFRLLKVLTPPNLRHSLQDGDDDDTDDDYDFGLEQGKLLLPNLQELTVGTCLRKVPLLVNFLRLRRTLGSSSHLRRLKMDLFNDSHKHVENKSIAVKFREFEKDGIGISVDIVDDGDYRLA
ncbi:hypothetical protein BT96DRAFT_1067073, partial [Gymnopus androsaceus JB14]